MQKRSNTIPIFEYQVTVSGLKKFDNGKLMDQPDVGDWGIRIRLKSISELGGFSKDKAEFIGWGACGNVYGWTLPPKTDGKRRWPETQVAVKIMNERSMTGDPIVWQRRFLNEKSAMAIEHPAILSYLYYNWLPTPIIVMRRAKKSLEKSLSECKQGMSEWDPLKKFTCLFGIAAGVCHLHSMRIIHRDLKPDNVMLDEHLYPHVGDFGLSRPLPEGPLHEAYSMTIGMGTPLYTAPEIVRGEPYSTAVDVYAFGMIMYYLLTETQPFHDLLEKTRKENQVTAIFRHVREGHRPAIPNYIPEQLHRIICACWDADPKQRPTMRQVLDVMHTMDIEAVFGDISDEVIAYRDYVYDATGKDE